MKRRFGQDLADFAIDPMVRGICAGNAKEISAGVFKCDVIQFKDTSMASQILS